VRRPASLSRSLTSPREFGPIAVLGIIAPGLLGFAQRADEVFEQETQAFDIAVLTFLRLPQETSTRPRLAAQRDDRHHRSLRLRPAAL
jgi:hypothetical protein